MRNSDGSETFFSLILVSSEVCLRNIITKKINNKNKYNVKHISLKRKLIERNDISMRESKIKPIFVEWNSETYFLKRNRG